MTPRKVRITLTVEGTTDRSAYEWANGIARYLQSELRDQHGADWPNDIEVDVQDYEDNIE